MIEKLTVLSVQIEESLPRPRVPADMSELEEMLRKQFVGQLNTEQMRHNAREFIDQSLHAVLKSGGCHSVKWKIDVTGEGTSFTITSAPEVLYGRVTHHSEEDGVHTFTDEILGTKTTGPTFFWAWTAHAQRVELELTLREGVVGPHDGPQARRAHLITRSG